MMSVGTMWFMMEPHLFNKCLLSVFLDVTKKMVNMNIRKENERAVRKSKRRFKKCHFHFWYALTEMFWL